jgi:hypothetical protein
MAAEETPEKIGFIHWMRLLLTNAATIKWLIIGGMSILGVGTVTNPMVQEKAVTIFETVTGTAEPEILPVPEGEVPPTPVAVRDDSAFHAQVRQSLAAMKQAIDNNKAGIIIIGLDIDELEDRREIESDANDLKLDGRLKAVEVEITHIKGLVQ